ncbi:MAG TPA: hypothetical protein VHJ17_16520, partial [Thermomonospora sp.]|nr:hypothetical protein [Thermomonospora sp.]
MPAPARSTVRRIAVPALVAAAVLPFGATGAHAGAAPERVDLEEIVTSLNERGGLYIHPGAGGLSDGQVDRLRAPLERAKLPVYLAVFPKGALPARPTALNRLIVDIYRAVKRKGTYAVVVGGEMRAYSWAFSQRQTVKLWNDAKRTGGGSLVNRLSRFAQGAGTARPGTPGPGPDVGAEPAVVTPRPEPEVPAGPE